MSSLAHQYDTAGAIAKVLKKCLQKSAPWRPDLRQLNDETNRPCFYSIRVGHKAWIFLRDELGDSVV